MTTTIARIRITGDEATELARATRHALNGRFASVSGWTEIQAMRECRHGCKLHARKRGAVTQYALLHNSGYGCQLGRSPETREVPVSVLPGATS